MIAPGNHDDDRSSRPGGGEISCREALDRVYEYLDGELGPEWTERVDRHIEVCRRCWPRFDLERRFIRHIRERGFVPARSRRLEQRIRTLLWNDTGESAP